MEWFERRLARCFRRRVFQEIWAECNFGNNVITHTDYIVVLCFASDAVTIYYIPYSLWSIIPVCDVSNLSDTKARLLLPKVMPESNTWSWCENFQATRLVKLVTDGISNSWNKNPASDLKNLSVTQARLVDFYWHEGIHKYYIVTTG